MKCVINPVVLAFALLLFVSPLLAQNSTGVYRTGIGLRGGWHPGFTVKHFVKESSAIEAILHTRYRTRGVMLTALYEKHAGAFDVDRLNWFYGLGIHVGHFRDGWYKDRWGYLYERDIVTVGIDGILGLEYHIGDIPFTIGVDMKPFFDIVNPGFGYWDGALSIRYTF